MIIDARLGSLWRLCLNLPSLVKMVDEKTQLVDMMLRRKNCKFANMLFRVLLLQIPIQSAKHLILTVIRETIESKTFLPLASIFNKVNFAYRHHLNVVMQSQV